MAYGIAKISNSSSGLAVSILIIVSSVFGFFTSSILILFPHFLVEPILSSSWLLTRVPGLFATLLLMARTIVIWSTSPPNLPDAVIATLVLLTIGSACFLGASWLGFLSAICLRNQPGCFLLRLFQLTTMVLLAVGAVTFQISSTLINSPGNYITRVFLLLTITFFGICCTDALLIVATSFIVIGVLSLWCMAIRVAILVDQGEPPPWTNQLN